MIRYYNFFNRFFLCLLVTGLFTACTGDSRSPSVLKDPDSTSVTSNLVDSFVDKPDWGNDGLTTLYHFNTIAGEVVRVAATERSDYSPFFLSGDANFIIAVKYLDSKIIKADTLLINEYVYTEIDSARIMQRKAGNNDYLLITAKETFKGQAITEKTVNFILLDINNLDHYTLAYEGTSSVRCYECIDGDFRASAILNKTPEIKDILYEYAYKSKWVYRPATQEEKDARHFINYEQKWQEDNQADNRLANGHSGIPETIYSTYYKEDIFKLTAEHGGEAAFIENERFKIMTYFRGNILGFDKQKQLYFPVFIESCITGCSKKVKFCSPAGIEVLYDEYSANETYKVQLDEIRFE